GLRAWFPPRSPPKAGGGKRTASARRSLLHNLSWRSGLVVVRRVEFDLFGLTGGRVLTESAAQRIEDCQARPTRPVAISPSPSAPLRTVRFAPDRPWAACLTI